MSTEPRTLRRAVSDAEKTQRREQILTAAKRVFADAGYRSTSIADVAREAGLSYGSIYWYFESKEVLFVALMQHEEHLLRDRIHGALAALGDGGDGEAVFRTAVRATFEFFEADKAVVKLLFRDSYVFGDRFERHLHGMYERFIDDIEALVAGAQTRGEIVPGPTRVIAFSVAALISQVALRRLTTDDGLDAGVIADFVVSVLLDGLKPRER